MSDPMTRRDVLRRAALVGGLSALGGVWTGVPARAQGAAASNDKLNIACVGVGGMGAGDLNNVASQNIVALCDVDERRAADSFKRFPDVPKYSDFRRMLLKEDKRIDAVVVSTPDHMHAPIAVMAMRMGKHVYVQKPLAHTVSEARIMHQVATQMGVVTQMGNQGHRAYTQLVELMQTRPVGAIREVHVMTDRPIWPQGMASYPTDTPPAPETLNWDMWLGHAEKRPYHPSYLPFVWRGWWDFGTGALGDMACHIMDGAFWALNLDAPTSVEAQSEGGTAVSAPKWSIIRFEFPRRGDREALSLTWYDGGKTIPQELLGDITIDPKFNGSLFIGDKGKVFVPHGGKPRLLPEADFKDFVFPGPSLPRSPGHYIEWIEACKTGDRKRPGSNFDYSGPMTEAILLGNVALRAGKKIEWDAAKMEVTNLPEAQQFVQHQYHNRWEL